MYTSVRNVLLSVVLLPGCWLDLDRLPRQPTASQHGALDAGATPAGPCTALVVIGLYEARGDSSGSNHPRGRATVALERPGHQVVLVSSYEPVDWEFTVGPGVVLDRVIASGYYRQGVVAPQGTSVQTSSHEERNSAEVPMAYEWKRAGPLVRRAEELTGLALNAFHGCYRMSALTLHANLEATTDCALGAGYDDSSVVNPPVCDGPSLERYPCVGASGPGVYRLKFCDDEADRGLYFARNMSCLEALGNCQVNHSLNPTASLACTWTQAEHTRLVLKDEKSPGLCDAYLGQWPIFVPSSP